MRANQRAEKNSLALSKHRNFIIWKDGENLELEKNYKISLKLILPVILLLCKTAYLYYKVYCQVNELCEQQQAQLCA